MGDRKQGINKAWPNTGELIKLAILNTISINKTANV